MWWKGVLDGDEETQREIAAVSTFEGFQRGMGQNAQKKTVMRKAEEFMKDVTVVWIHRRGGVEDSDGSEFVRFREDCYFRTA